MSNELDDALAAVDAAHSDYQAKRERARTLYLAAAPYKVGDVIGRAVTRGHGLAAKEVREEYQIGSITARIEGGIRPMRGYYGFKRLASGKFGDSRHELYGVEMSHGGWQKVGEVAP